MKAGTSSTLFSTKRGARRYRLIVETATALFLEKGYETTSINEIIHLSGGSLSTVYQKFHNKEGLFWAVFESMIHEVRKRYVTFPIWEGDSQTALKNLVTQIYENMFEPKVMRLLLMTVQIETLREKAANVMFRELFEPLLNILVKIERRYDLRFIFETDETLLCVLRHARGSVMEFFMSPPHKAEENKRAGIDQTTALLLRLIEGSTTKQEETGETK